MDVCRYEQEALKTGDQEGGSKICERLMMMLTLLHGELLALRAIAEGQMEAIDGADDDDEEEE